MVKIIRLKDLDITKRQKELDKEKKEIEMKFEKWTTRYCFICKQKMIHVGGLVWQCKHCDVLDSITHTVLPYGRDEYKDKRKVFLEKGY